MGLLSGLGRWMGLRPPPDAALGQAIARAVATVDPLLKTVSGYERKLAPAVGHALRYCKQLAAEIPGPVEINSRAFGADPLVHAMFAAPGDIADMLGKSRELREFLADPVRCEGDDFFALLGMRQREKAVTGMALQGEMLRNDVPQRLLYFADHTLGELGSQPDATRQRLQVAAFDSLAQGFAAGVVDLRQERQDARTASSLAHGADAGRRQAVEDRQRQAIAALAPESLLKSFAEWLAAPEGRLYLKPSVVAVDRMGVIARDADAGGNFSILSFPELVARDRRQWIVMMARINRKDVLDAMQRQQQANRYLII